MKKNCLISICLILFTCNIAFAAGWVTLKAGGKTIELYTDSITPNTTDFGSDVYTYWVQTKKQDGIYQMLLASSCNTNNNSILKTVKLSLSGKILSQKENNPPIVQQITEGSAAEAANKYVCNIDQIKFKDVDAYAEIAQKALDEQNFELARINALKAYDGTIKLSNEGYSPIHTADALDLIARAYSGLGNFVGSLRAWNEALNIAQSYTDTEFIQTLTTRRDLMQGIIDTQNKATQEEQEKQLKKQQTKDNLINTGVQIIRSFTGYY